MQLTVFSLLTATTSVVSAWQFMGYPDPNYEGVEAIYRSGGPGAITYCFHTNSQWSSFIWYQVYRWTRGFLIWI